MKKKIIIIAKYLILFLPFLTSLWLVTSSLNWGIPDPKIRDIVLPDNDEARKKTVEKIINLSQKNIHKRESFVIEGQEEDNSIRNLRIARRYLLYSENPDEMMALAGFSGINPRALNFKLKCFHYGGGYLYPMGAMVALGRLVDGKNLKVSMKDMISDNITIGQMYIWARAFNIIILVIGFAGLFLLFYSQGLTKTNAVFFSSIIITSPVVMNWATVIKPHLMGAVLLILSAGVVLYGRKRECLKNTISFQCFWLESPARRNI